LHLLANLRSVEAGEHQRQYTFQIPHLGYQTQTRPPLHFPSQEMSGTGSAEAELEKSSSQDSRDSKFRWLNTRIGEHTNEASQRALFMLPTLCYVSPCCVHIKYVKLQVQSCVSSKKLRQTIDSDDKLFYFGVMAKHEYRRKKWKISFFYFSKC
jgi:hypothetical protein